MNKKIAWKTELRKIVEIALIVIAFCYIARFIARGWPEIADRLRGARWSYLIAAAGLFWVFFIFRFAAWLMMLRFYKLRPKLTQAINIWFLSEFSRYVPGNIWSFVGRIYLSEKAGLSKRKVAMTMALEVIYLVGASFIFAGLFFLLKPDAVENIPRWPLLIIIPIVLLMIVPKLFERFMNMILARMKKEPISIDLSWQKILILLFLYIIAWGAYGLGSYLVLVGFVGSLESMAIWLVSAFVLAWLVGYLSIITPMGLGVREGIIVLMLGPLISWPIASFVAMATRVWLMIGELSLIAGVGIINLRHNRRQKQQKITKWVVRHKHEIGLGVLILFYIVYFSIFTMLRHGKYLSSYHDLGNMDQTIWNTAHGRIFQMTAVDGVDSVSRLNYHGDLLLIVLAPIYWIVESPYILLFLQSAMIALGALPLWWLGKEVLKNKTLAFMICAIFLMFPPMQRANIFDFHTVKLAIPLILAMFYFAYKKRYWAFLIGAIVLLFAKENLTFVVGMMGIYIAVKNRDWKIGLALIGIAGVWFYVLMYQIMPHIRGGEHFALNYYEQIGNTPSRVLVNTIWHPFSGIGRLLTISTIRYLIYFLLPLGFFGVLSPYLLLAGPEIAINLLSNFWPMHTIYYQYTAIITPFAFIAAVFGIRNFFDWTEDLTKKNIWFGRYRIALIILVLLIGSGLAIWRWSPLPGMYRSEEIVWSYQNPWKTEVDKIIADIPDDASVSVTERIGPHLTHRINAYHFPYGVGEAQYVFVQDEGEFSGEILPIVKDGMGKIRQDKRYKLIFKKNEVEIYKLVKRD